MHAPIRNAAIATILGAALAISATPALADHGRHRGWDHQDRNWDRGDDESCARNRDARWDSRGSCDDPRPACDNGRDAYYDDPQYDNSQYDNSQYGYDDPQVVVIERPAPRYVVVRPASDLMISLSALFGGVPVHARIDHQRSYRGTPVTYRSWANNGRQAAYRR